MDVGDADEMEKFREVGSEAEGVEGAGHRMGEPVHPPSQEAAGVGEGGLDPEVAAAGPVDRASQLRVGGGGEEGDDAVQEEHHHERRAGHAGGDAREHEDAGPDHGADTDHGHVEEPHLSA